MYIYLETAILAQEDHGCLLITRLAVLTGGVPDGDTSLELGLSW